ncbi:hypothetical protein [Streptomyces rectiverticillatus]|uniref:hypothetical protein n=1 Tax=Streptomyces rectiverticillatus TaxID=173860 RepID=UPI0015C36B04|nr:hypothetical protein [Streptomyces rectiverticillatus]
MDETTATTAHARQIVTSDECQAAYQGAQDAASTYGPVSRRPPPTRSYAGCSPRLGS